MEEEKKPMDLLDLSDDILLDILSLVDPIDLVNIYNVCKRLRGLAGRTINNVVLNLNLTGIGCFPNIKSIDILDRIRVNKNWFDGQFNRHRVLLKNLKKSEIVVDEEHLYINYEGSIRKYDRVWYNGYLSSLYIDIGELYDPKISSFAKKGNVIFTGSWSGTFMIFQDQKPILRKAKSGDSPIWGADFCPKNDVYVGSFFNDIKILNKRPNEDYLSVVDALPMGSRVLQIGPSGEQLLVTRDRCVDLYDFHTKTTEQLDGLFRPESLLWKDNNTFFSGHWDGSLRLFDLRTKSLYRKFNIERGSMWDSDPINCLQYDGQNTVICGFKDSYKVHVRDLRTRRILREFKVPRFTSSETINYLEQIVAEPRFLFVLTSSSLELHDFSARTGFE